MAFATAERQPDIEIAAAAGALTAAAGALKVATERLKTALATGTAPLTINPREDTPAKRTAVTGIVGVLKPFLAKQGQQMARRIGTGYARSKARQPDRRKDATAKDKLEDLALEIVDAAGLDWSELAGTVDRYLKQAALAGVAQAGTALDVGHDIFSQANEWALAYGESRGAELVGMQYTGGGELIPNPDAEWAITDTTRAKLQALIVRALKDGLPVSELEKLITADPTFGAARARMIATTEVAMANAGGQLQVGKLVGHTSKRSLLSGDHSPDSDLSCDVNAAESAHGIPIDEPFPSGDMHSPFHPNCVCLTQTFTPGAG